MVFTARQFEFRFPRPALVMGIVNVTPDSFYPDSRTLAHDQAIARGRELFDAGCDVVDVGARRLRVVETRGHTWGHCAYFEEATGFLFTGDAVQGRGVRSSDGDTMFCPMYLNVPEMRAGLRRLLELPFTMLCPAHAEPLEREAGLALLERSLGFIEDVDALSRDLLAERGGDPVVTSELCARIAALVIWALISMASAPRTTA